MLKRVLIANRGEIARRIARTCARLDIEYVCVYSTADARADHLAGAFATVHLGGAPAVESYLDIDKLVDAAVREGCDAVHPGYGFLSENAVFAERAREAGLVFIGPAPQTIRSMGDKATARALMAAAGVPVLPGSAQATESVGTLVADAREVGYPVILKPAAGGGGKGMRVVHREADLPEAAAEAVRLGRAAFGDGRVLVERYLPAPRHIEVQVFGDTHGNVVHLYERDCSLQRRHQKIVEEAPATGLDPRVRQAMQEAAVRGASALDYVNAGTFEFIVGENGEFFFLEVNTRLQVEHPVTEEVTGLDLVEWQLRVAAGEPLPLAQDAITCSGHAVECRVYAEDPAAGFQPSPGHALLVHWPATLRVEAAFDTAGTASEHYDPMVAKLVAHAPDRATALRRLSAGLKATSVLGLTTNLGFLTRLLDEPKVLTGHTDTHLVDGLVLAERDTHLDRALACVAAMAAVPARGGGSPWLGGLGPVDRTALDPDAPLGRVTTQHAGVLRRATVLARSGTAVTVRVDGRRHLVTAVPEQGRWTGRVADTTWSGLRDGDRHELCVGGERFAFTEHVRQGRGGGSLDHQVRATLPGVVVALPRAEGDRVEAGDTVLVIEAMKMEHRLPAPVPGRIVSLGCAEGDQVSAGQVLAELLPEETPAGAEGAAGASVPHNETDRT
ncbi:acetyl/propionyl/methylcrotonyl-CoA carboxylase subunit alpha [Actinacidiphila glaucinigra]|uniref:acetyl/propionyl/methylcrotonyl-CoA carboxylase subunit alpha n=1 Tax=Actinacidiphila glaucinigra TaxID=235986 RepID=UPI002E33C02E|nr:biotin carboxylase N-terminal domain-containing protein [Actinacidiphila glaucinigra]